MKTKPKHRVLLIREMPGSCADCYGDLSAAPDTSCKQDFAEVQQTADRIGQIYNATRERLDPDQADITCIDPRAQIVLWAEIFRHIYLFRPNLKTTLRLLTQSFAIPAVIVNAQILSHRGQLPSTNTLLKKLQPTP